MDPPIAAVKNKFEKTNETNHAKNYECGLCDTEVVYKIAQELLPGLAQSCIDSTTGGIFTSAGSVAAHTRKEMSDYLTRRSETYVAEFLLSENASMLELSEHPKDIVINLIDDYSATKRNMFSRVSEWVLSDRRDDRIDDFVQEMEVNGFWLLPRREYVASLLLKNVDYKNAFHCDMVCSSDDELVKHRAECKFRPLDCTSEGCTTRYCAAQKENHESVCPFKVLPCEQKCSDFVMRREMDRHCVTLCPMKLVNCAFYSVGCKTNIPRCNVQQHNADDLSSHLLYFIRSAHKGASDEDLKQRVEQILSLSNTEKLAKARDTRALTFLIKDAEAKLGPLNVPNKPHADSTNGEDSHNTESPTKTEVSIVKDVSESPKKKEENPGSQSVMSSTEKPVITEDDTKLPTKQVHQESPKAADSPVKVEGIKDKHESPSSPVQEKHEQSESPLKKEALKDPQDENSNKPAAEEPPTKVKEELSNAVTEKTKQLSGNDEEDTKMPSDEEKSKQLSSSDEQEVAKSPLKDTVKESSRSDEEESTKSTEKETVKE